jgi:hypothetical protein
VAARVDIGGSWCLNLYELLVLDTAARLVSPASVGAVATMSSVYDPAWGPSSAIDMLVDLSQAGLPLGGSGLAHTVCAGNQWWRVAFPGGTPRNVSTVYFFNRQDGGLGTRITSGRGNVTLLRADGSEAGQYPLASGAVTTMAVQPAAPPAGMPVATATEEQKQRLVKSVRVTACAGCCECTVREQAAWGGQT